MEHLCIAVCTYLVEEALAAADTALIAAEAVLQLLVLIRATV